MFLYEGTLKILPTESTTFRDAYNVRLAETTIIDIAWLHGTARPTLCILHEDRKQARHVITYVLDMQEKELLPGEQLRKDDAMEYVYFMTIFDLPVFATQARGANQMWSTRRKY